MSKYDQIPDNAVFRIRGNDLTIFLKGEKGILIYFRPEGFFVNPPTDTNKEYMIMKKLENRGFEAISRAEFEDIRKEFGHTKPVDVVFLGEINADDEVSSDTSGEHESSSELAKEVTKSTDSDVASLKSALRKLIDIGAGSSYGAQVIRNEIAKRGYEAGGSGGEAAHPSVETKNIEDYLTANLLDGDPVQSGQMIASTEVLEVVTALISEEIKRAKKELLKEAIQSYWKTYSQDGETFRYCEVCGRPAPEGDCNCRMIIQEKLLELERGQ